MAYDTRYDPSDDAAMNGIVAHSQVYLKGGSAFTTTTSPTLAQVEAMIDRRVAIIAIELSKHGYSATQAVGTVGELVCQVLTSGVIYGTLMDIEMGKPSASNVRNEGSRWQMYERRWLELMEIISSSALEHLGATRSRDLSAGLEFRGRTWDEQDTYDEDSDLKGAMFPRGILEPNPRHTTDDDEVVTS